MLGKQVTRTSSGVRTWTHGEGGEVAEQQQHGRASVGKPSGCNCDAATQNGVAAQSPHRFTVRPAGDEVHPDLDDRPVFPRFGPGPCACMPIYVGCCIVTGRLLRLPLAAARRTVPGLPSKNSLDQGRAVYVPHLTIVNLRIFLLNHQLSQPTLGRSVGMSVYLSYICGDG